MRRAVIVATAILFCAGQAFGKPTGAPLSLEQMARVKFPEPPLTAAEERVVRAARDGTEADCRDLGGGDDPAKVDAWPASRNVRANLIRWLFVDRGARELVDPKGVAIRGARITGRLDLSFTNVLFPLFLSGCRLAQDLDVRYAKMPVLSLEGSWTRAIKADGLKLEGDILLRNGFHAQGEVRLLGAGIGGNLDAKGGTFKNPKGYALNADRIKVTGSVFLTIGFGAEGDVRLVDAEITGQLAVVDAWLDALELESAHITGPFFWGNIHKDAHPDFPSKEWKPYLDLINAKVGALADKEASWPAWGRLRLDGFVYDRIAAGPIDAAARLRWLHLQPDWLGFRPQPYEQLIAVLRNMGHEDQVAEVAIAEKLDLREHGGLGRWSKFWSFVLYHAVGYGYEPWRVFKWMAMLVLLGTLIFWSAHLSAVGVMVPSDKEAYERDERTEKAPLPHYYPKFNALVYSLDVIFPFDLGQKSHWRLSERQSGAFVYWIFEGWSLVQLVVGWVLLLVAAAVAAGLVK
jgi:hypothetical protein